MLCYVARRCVLYSWISTTALRSVLSFLQIRQTFFYPVDGGSTFFWILLPSCQAMTHLILEYMYVNRHIIAAFYCKCPRKGTKSDMVFYICVLVINFVPSPRVPNLSIMTQKWVIMVLFNKLKSVPTQTYFSMRCLCTPTMCINCFNFVTF